MKQKCEIGRSAFGFEIDKTFYKRAKDEMLATDDTQVTFDMLGVI